MQVSVASNGAAVLEPSWTQEAVEADFESREHKRYIRCVARLNRQHALVVCFGREGHGTRLLGEHHRFHVEFQHARAQQSDDRLTLGKSAEGCQFGESGLLFVRAPGRR